MSEPAARQRTRLAGLIRALRESGLDPDRTGLADALWLAQYSTPTAPPPARAGRAAAPEPRPEQEPGAAPGHRPGRRQEPAAGPARLDGRAPRAGDDTVMLYADPASAPGGAPGGAGEPPRDALRVGVPEARSLPSLLELERALRPLQRYRPPARPPGRPGDLPIDEAATVERTARTGGLLLPAFREEPRGHTELQLLMDAASAMRVWQLMLGELAEVFRRLGAFRDIQVHYLHEAPDGSVAVSRRFDPAAAVLHPARQLRDPTGRRLTVVVSDCTGPLWRSGAAHRLLHSLARHAPVAVVQPLPQRLWARTRLPVGHGLLLREEGPAASARLRFVAEEFGYPPARPPGAVPVPVLPPTPGALGAWAGLLAGPGAGPVPAAVGWVRADQPPAAARRAPGGPRTPAALVARFRAQASPGAAQLAVYLAAGPLFLPVMQLIQRTMLPDSGPAELSEVLLSGLVRRLEGSAGDGLWYAFAEGVHDELLADLGHDEAILVLKHCSGYVEQRFGRTGPNFPALALAELTGGERLAPEAAEAASGPLGEPAEGIGWPTGEPSAPPGSQEWAQQRLRQPFAQVTAKVLRRFLREPPARRTGPPGVQPPSRTVQQARELAELFATEGKVQHQLDAVRLLRDAADRQRAAGRGTDPELWSELAEQQLRLWRVQGDAELLAAARTAASTAATHPGSVRARSVLARVLHAAAGERRALGDTGEALRLLRQADREFAAVSATPGLAPDAALALTLERVEVLAEQWRLSGDTGLLQESVGTVEAVADAWPRGRPQPSGLPLAHGRALLRLAGAAQATERARVYAEQAARSLRAGCEALAREAAQPRARVAALLDLVDALLLTERDFEAAAEPIAQARWLTEDQELRAACAARSGRLARRRYETSGDPAELLAAAEHFEQASRSVSRDRAEYSDLIEEWGAALLVRASLPDGGRYVSRAVRVLRDCRMETPGGHPRLALRLLMLGQALVARYRQAGDLVDLREAEHLFTTATHSAREARTGARAWFELGETHRRAYRHTHRPERLDQAADAYRRAVAAAAEDGAPEEAGEEILRLSARAHHQWGVVLEEASRPRAAGEAYRSALDEWRRLPGGEEEAEPTRARLAALRAR
ncbi:SAV_2336 N-terminal domain-related protein [Streptomyces hoynatensis]|uniref:Tetratricopeptide repeat protein n=1 Tax=Streptomyces hoynatensis TaxID=1141874 RepID=A0A3A9YYX3_9ACTN|nr:SAV_2336 N-terminal domain-related protein [Streptomyces hoynatensis]RKN40457.1 hypothetical protein D7294_18625 [Streptomyces hoynatensis]